ncbi:Nuclear localization sequence-binding protein [Cyberlindnera fabianii]|uniref:Nuclear localization sequence-binding protein n=1 Tax=Cyberlindnera fabianii TaxID=36022 RepID=A0A1V2L524_CYBFA|nr:Nuclear localization sequence-binding protein [Cyberlindnera fabianii]
MAKTSKQDKKAAPAKVADKKSKKRKAEEDATPAKKQKTDEEPATLFVGRLSWNVDDEWLKSEFEALGGVTGARVIMERATGKSRGYGYVDFDSKSAAEKALKEYQGREIDGRPINLDMSSSKPQAANNNRGADRASKFGDTPSEPSDTLFLGNLSFQCDRDTLFSTFGEHGSVISVRIPTHPETEQPKGFGYVQFSSIDEAKAAHAALNGSYIAGRPVRLDFSAPRDPSQRKSFGGDRKSFGGDRKSFGGRERKSFGTGANSTPAASRNTAEFKGKKMTFD